MDIQKKELHLLDLSEDDFYNYHGGGLRELVAKAVHYLKCDCKWDIEWNMNPDMTLKM